MDLNSLNQKIINCRKCPRLVEYREKISIMKKKAFRDWDYWGRPVTSFGDINGRILVVGLAPGPHGSNRTGRMFTGDASGVFLFRALHKAGFANQSTAININDGLELKDLLISAVCRCVPPDNKPSRSEITNCLPYLTEEIKLMDNLQGFVALGRIAFDNLFSIYSSRAITIAKHDFQHAGYYYLGDSTPWLIASYHPSQQNTLTGRLTEAMFDNVWEMARTSLK